MASVSDAAMMYPRRSTSQPSAALLAKESQDIRQLAGSAAMMISLREPEGCDSQPGASPWARAKAEQPAAMCARAAGPVFLSAAIQLSRPLADGEKAQPAGDAAMM